ncbi:4-hydroxy-tetrahydrodipicolinate synthase [Leuconostoc pseudomesenteroides]|uniref:4-hydroxy-tetrahydrodipicolinate synthase n=1 Tax=Leuconostoc falkenbergense TaxID=2766470 RepID=UPI000A03BF09|nr:4-hydroxy-tetrahydrodipicolinate synthase [Leuconostoc pseudomesenteroides]ORI55454.1 4-hydroxy-tetrahydrodipicolinate synthase [Leuconostoc pseudomesenteroides]ORI75911.1 4-hydroxy-tetrahydrodipicolinate synthase [Leuconostoc pseudomesenteroides]ORI82616.1 4-hydroxy-tetrahydrodipicolinate synthase [Leuconostoc pseudomesenteroides]
MYENIRLITAIVTPFTADDSIDYDSLDSLIEHLLQHGTQGFVVAGTTGESPALTHEEKLALTTHIVQQVSGRALVIANAGSNNTKESVMAARELSAITGVDGILAVTPYYNKPSQAGMIAHFEAIADAASKPVMLYNIPGRTVVGLTLDSVLKLAKHPNINAIKETTSVDLIVAEVAGTTDFSVYTGEDAMTLSAYVVGGAGTISVASHLYGDEMTALFKAMATNNWQEAGRLQRYLTPRMNALFAYPSPAPVKTKLADLGLIRKDVRLPILALAEAEKAHLNDLLENS